MSSVDQVVVGLVGNRALSGEVQEIRVAPWSREDIRSDHT